MLRHVSRPNTTQFSSVTELDALHSILISRLENICNVTGYDCFFAQIVDCLQSVSFSKLLVVTRNEKLGRGG